VLARDIAAPANRVTDIMNGESAVSTATVILLGRRLGASAECWLDL
jgi:plasmid maintenance system antidote protein VapI